MIYCPGAEPSRDPLQLYDFLNDQAIRSSRLLCVFHLAKFPLDTEINEFFDMVFVPMIMCGLILTSRESFRFLLFEQHFGQLNLIALVYQDKKKRIIKPEWIQILSVTPMPWQELCYGVINFAMGNHFVGLAIPLRGIHRYCHLKIDSRFAGL